jgi:hypothetical protein
MQIFSLLEFSQISNRIDGEKMKVAKNPILLTHIGQQLLGSFLDPHLTKGPKIREFRQHTFVVLMDVYIGSCIWQL